MGNFASREGIIITYEKDGLRAYGEVAPLPGFSIDNLIEVKSVLLSNRNLINDFIDSENYDELLNELSNSHPYPSLLFGIDTLIHDLKAKQQKIPFQELLFGKGTNQVLCNTTIGMQTTEEALNQAELKIKEGFRTIKVKVGKDFQKEKEVLYSLRDHYPDIKLRIDANQAWEKGEAVTLLNQLSSLNIEYCEQPVSAENISDLKWVSDRTEIPIAADESLANKDNIIKIFENKSCDLIVIKPALFGSFEEINVTKQLANSHNMVVVFTTTLDGVIGRKVTSVLASGLGSTNFAHGLGTGSFFYESYSSSEHIENGRYLLNECEPGLGHPIDLVQLKEVC